MSILNLFIKYVSLNVLGMIGLSCYILADTFFVARGIGADGLTALNIAIPIFNFINGLGLMLAMGSATKYAILKTQNKNDEANTVFTNALIYILIISLIFISIGILFTKNIRRSSNFSTFHKNLMSYFVRIINYIFKCF